MGAPKGNKYAEGHGRPPTHTDPIKFDNLIQDYFEWIEGEQGQKEVTRTVKDDDGEKEITETVTYWIRRPEPPTLTGLALHLGFADKCSIYDYKEKESFSHSIKRAVSRIEKYHEIATAYGEKCTGNIFILKNFGWKDKVDHDITSGGKTLDQTMKIQVMDYSDDSEAE